MDSNILKPLRTIHRLALVCLLTTIFAKASYEVTIYERTNFNQDDVAHFSQLAKCAAPNHPLTKKLYVNVYLGSDDSLKCKISPPPRTRRWGFFAYFWSFFVAKPEIQPHEVAWVRVRMPQNSRQILEMTKFVSHVELRMTTKGVSQGLEGFTAIGRHRHDKIIFIPTRVADTLPVYQFQLMNDLSDIPVKCVPFYGYVSSTPTIWLAKDNDKDKLACLVMGLYSERPNVKLSKFIKTVTLQASYKTNAIQLSPAKHQAENFAVETITPSRCLVTWNTLKQYNATNSSERRKPSSSSSPLLSSASSNFRKLNMPQASGIFSEVGINAMLLSTVKVSVDDDTYTHKDTETIFALKAKRKAYWTFFFDNGEGILYECGVNKNDEMKHLEFYLPLRETMKSIKALERDRKVFSGEEEIVTGSSVYPCFIRPVDSKGKVDKQKAKAGEFDLEIFNHPPDKQWKLFAAKKQKPMFQLCASEEKDEKANNAETTFTIQSEKSSSGSSIKCIYKNHPK